MTLEHLDDELSGLIIQGVRKLQEDQACVGVKTVGKVYTADDLAEVNALLPNLGCENSISIALTGDGCVVMNRKRDLKAIQ